MADELMDAETPRGSVSDISEAPVAAEPPAPRAIVCCTTCTSECCSLCRACGNCCECCHCRCARCAVKQRTKSANAPSATTTTTTTTTKAVGPAVTGTSVPMLEAMRLPVFGMLNATPHLSRDVNTSVAATDLLSKPPGGYKTTTVVEETVTTTRSSRTNQKKVTDTDNASSAAGAMDTTATVAPLADSENVREYRSVSPGGTETVRTEWTEADTGRVVSQTVSKKSSKTTSSAPSPAGEMVS